jgi:hypothetical protein
MLKDEQGLHLLVFFIVFVTDVLVDSNLLKYIKRLHFNEAASVRRCLCVLFVGSFLFGCNRFPCSGDYFVFILQFLADPLAFNCVPCYLTVQ